MQSPTLIEIENTASLELEVYDTEGILLANAFSKFVKIQYNSQPNKFITITNDQVSLFVIHFICFCDDNYICLNKILKYFRI